MNQNIRFPSYTNQPAPSNRALPPGPSSRLQNVPKTGNSWGFGGQTNGQTAQSVSRQPSAGPTSFAQTIGASQPATPLDLSEFPSLSGNSQTQFQNPGQAIWQRNSQQTPIQRRQPQPQHPHVSHGQMPQNPPGNPPRQDLGSRDTEDLFTGSNQLQGTFDDFRQDNQTRNHNPLAATRQPQPAKVEDFPPLGRSDPVDADAERRSPFGAFASSNPFQPSSNQGPHLPSLTSASSIISSSNGLSGAGDRGLSPSVFGSSRVPLGNGRMDTSAGHEGDRPNGFGTQTSQSNGNNFHTRLHDIEENGAHTQPMGVPGQPDHASSSLSPSQQAIGTAPLTYAERMGPRGVIARLNSENPLEKGLARGIPLESLGMNLHPSQPMYESWGGPFGDASSRPLRPDFDLPDCYTVENVHRVREKLPSFGDETLFYIFYSQPRDAMQEMAATELHNRNWRFHKPAQMWLTKDPTLEPIRTDPKGEQGSYVFFDHRRWEKHRSDEPSLTSGTQSEFYLQYEDLAPTTGRPT